MASTAWTIQLRIMTASTAPRLFGQLGGAAKKSGAEVPAAEKALKGFGWASKAAAQEVRELTREMRAMARAAGRLLNTFKNVNSAVSVVQRGFQMSEFTEPSSLVANVQLSYDASKRVTLTLLATNVYTKCFGGSQQAWTNGDGHINCWYSSPTVYAGNLFNPGTQVQNSVAFPYAPAVGNVFQQAFGSQANPFNLFVNVAVKL